MVHKKLTAVIIAKDEEDKISLCLESIKWVDEIVVVDDMSFDKTAEICLSYGAKVIKHDFDEQRNIGIDNASGEWVLQLDADEIVSNSLRNKIQEVIVKNSSYAAYQFRRKNYYLGHFMRYGGWYGYATKLFRKDSGKYVGRNIHETLEISGNIGIIDADIEHYPFRSISEYIERQNFYSSIESDVILYGKRNFNKRALIYHILFRPLKLFWKNYIKKKGYKDGMYGLIFSVLSAWRYFLIYAKVWERLISEKGSNLDM